MLIIRFSFSKLKINLKNFKRRNGSSFDMVGKTMHSNKSVQMFKYNHKSGLTYYHFSVPSPLNYFSITFKNNYDVASGLFYSSVQDCLNFHFMKNHGQILTSMTALSNNSNSNTFGFSSDLQAPFFKMSKIALDYFSNENYFLGYIKNISDDFINRQIMLYALNRLVEYELFPSTKLTLSKKYDQSSFSKIFKKAFNLGDACIFTLGSFPQSIIIDLIEKYVQDYGEYTYKIPKINENPTFDQKTTILKPIIEKFPIPNVKTYLYVNKPRKCEISLLLLEIFHDLLKNETNSIFHKYIIATKHALKISDYSRVSYISQIPLYTVGFDTISVPDSSFFKNLIFKIFCLSLNRFYDLKACKSILQQIFVLNPLDKFSTLEVNKRVIFLQYNGYDALNFFSNEFYEDICNQISNKPSILNENFEDLIVKNPNYRLFEVFNTSEQNDTFEKCKNELKKSFQGIKNLSNICTSIPKDHKLDMSELEKNIYENMATNFYFKIEELKINNMDIKFVHSQNDIISINLFLSLTSLTSSELLNTHFSCLKRRAILEKSVCSIFQDSNIINSIVLSANFIPCIIGKRSFETDYGIMISLYMVYNNIENLGEIFRIILNDPFDNMKVTVQKAVLFNYIKSKYIIPTPHDFSLSIPYCASQVDKLDFINDLMVGKRQFDHLLGLYNDKIYDMENYFHNSKNIELLHRDVFKKINRNIRITCATPQKYIEQISEKLSSFKISNSFDEEDIVFIKNKDLKIKYENKKFSYIESYKIPATFKPLDFLTLEILANILVNKFNIKKSEYESVIFKQTYNTFSIGLTGNSNDVNFYKTYINEFYEYIRKRKYSAQELQISKLKAYYSLNMNNNPHRFSKFLLYLNIDEDYYRRKIEDVRTFSEDNLQNIINKLREDSPSTLIISP